MADASLGLLDESNSVFIELNWSTLVAAKLKVSTNCSVITSENLGAISTRSSNPLFCISNLVKGFLFSMAVLIASSSLVYISSIWFVTLNAKSSSISADINSDV